ncbi:MAG: cytochrome c5 family protein [Gammaproteobacteria bacterium]|nr:MAG: cytochrome c5 family protein [Gammaproteobacteria bacterium]
MSEQYSFTRMLWISVIFMLAVFLQACGQNDGGSAAKKAPQTTQSAGASAEVAAIDAEQLYKAACQACHLAGVANAPKLDDKAAWAPRIATGVDALIKSAINGKNAMPPKGGRLDYSDNQIAAIVKYMVSQAQ